MKIKTNDKVKILSGKDRGKIGKVIQVFRGEGKIVVEGTNLIKKHLRAKSKTEKGQVIELAAPLSVSKVMLVCPACDQPQRVRFKSEGGAKQRVCRKCQAPIA